MNTTPRLFTLPDNLIQVSSNDWTEELEQLHKTWETGSKAIFITGQANSGKTDLAIVFGQRVCPDSVYLIRYTDTLRTTIADMPMLGYVQIPPDWSLADDFYEEQRCCEKLQILQHYYPEALFIIDGVNVETVRQEPEYVQLLSLKARFLFTGQGHFDEETVHLSGKGDLTQLEKKLERLAEEQQRVLCCAALLSDYGLQKPRFLECLSDAEKDALGTLLDSGLLAARNDGTVTIRPDIREKYLQIMRPTEEDCTAFLKELAFFTTPTSCYSPAGYRQVCDCFANASKYLKDKAGTYAKYAAQMWRDSGDYVPSFPYFEKYLERQTALKPRSELDWAQALCENGAMNWFRAVTSSEGQKRIALKQMAAKQMEEGIALHEKNRQPSHPDVAEARMAYATILQNENWITADEYAEETLNDQLAVLPQDHPALVSTYLSYAMLHYHWSQVGERRTYAEKALLITEKLDYIHKDLPMIYRVLSDCAVTVEQRIKYAQKSLMAHQLQMPWNQNGIFRCLTRLAQLCGEVPDRKMQRTYLEQALDLLTGMLPPKHPKLRKIQRDLEESAE